MKVCHPVSTFFEPVFRYVNPVSCISVRFEATETMLYFHGATVDQSLYPPVKRHFKFRSPSR